MNIRKLARGQECTVNSPHCTEDAETTVLAHLRMFGNAGIGQKPPDLHGVFACFNCHELIDRRAMNSFFEENRHWYLVKAVLKTHDIIFKELRK